MKTLLIALILTFAFSTSAQAGKGRITSVSPDSSSRIGAISTAVHGEGCTYTIVERLYASVYAKGVDSLTLQVVTDDQVIPLRAWGLPKNYNYGVNYCCGSFVVPSGQSWSLVWVLEKPKGKNRIVQVVEQFASSCDAPQN
jgi:hypothetical protein